MFLWVRSGGFFTFNVSVRFVVFVVVLLRFVAFSILVLGFQFACRRRS